MWETHPLNIQLALNKIILRIMGSYEVLHDTFMGMLSRCLMTQVMVIN
ncbi:hypothetical protein L345_12109 [Ophiophagus hannah]|uniref:Uncharacterized protein n=1 Tax=Ophiophagus hannah TaxID=8665 RepID=V8NJJ7_OPHHA|nr:hypothetical protein L345_12109 [Ophiophagus hannah]